MTQPTEQFQHEINGAIRSFALTFPEATEGSSCVNRASKAGGKNFVFLGEKESKPTSVTSSTRQYRRSSDSLPTTPALTSVGLAGQCFDSRRTIRHPLRTSSGGSPRVRFSWPPRRSLPSQRNPSVTHNATMVDRVRCVTPGRSCAGR
jgi:hypothetical protein